MPAMKRLIFDLDNTLCTTQKGDYAHATPHYDMIEKLKSYRLQGFEIIISTSRNMQTYQCNTGKIAANTLPIIIDWLNQHHVPFDEIYIGKPWCGTEGFYIDDRAIRPKEFLTLSYPELIQLIASQEGHL
jgi:capsule biosynthesis phosphatase